MKKVLKSMFGLVFTWLLVIALGTFIYLDMTHSGPLQGLITFVCVVLFFVYYDLNNKDLQLQELNGKNLSFSLQGIKTKLKSLKTK